MIALVRYTTATLLHSQRYLAPVLLFLAAVGISSSNDSGPLPPLYGLCAGVLFVCATWFTIALISNEDPAHRAITIVSAGSSSRVLLASVTVAILGCAALAVVGLVLPLFAGVHNAGAADLIVGGAAELTGAAMGISIGLLVSRLVIQRQGYALVAAIALVLTVLLVPGLPPVNAMIRLMASATRSAPLIWPALGSLTLALALLGLAAAATQFIATRKE
ncbi:MAG TPA: hypothetical protein VFO16_02135 [Pseudonocardiaceae bacterium]|nr:hypothetical protein [Pseudonocardiaceae bacterium]